MEVDEHLMMYPMMKPCQAERIILCIDACDDRPRFAGGQQGAKQMSTLSMIKKCGEAFLVNKAAMNSEHQFALLAFKANLCYISSFSNKVTDLVKQLQNITPNPTPEQPSCLARVFETVHEKVLKNGEDDENPLRILLFFGRSGSCVIGENVLSNHKNVLVDVLYIHRPLLSAKEKKRVISNYSELKSCLSEKSFCYASLCDSLLAYKYTMKMLMHPNLRLPNVNV